MPQTPETLRNEPTGLLTQPYGFPTLTQQVPRLHNQDAIDDGEEDPELSGDALTAEGWLRSPVTQWVVAALQQEADAVGEDFDTTDSPAVERKRATELRTLRRILRLIESTPHLFTNDTQAGN